MKELTYRRYLLAVLAVVLALNLVDRFALGLALQDIKVDLRLSDTQLGFLTGLAFALFYSLMGIPIARWADNGDRVTIIALAAALWSAAVAVCGMATTFVQLLATRVAAAVGEAGCMPPAQSLIADYFTRAERPRAMALYLLGGPLGVVIGYAVAGWMNELYGWRLMFVSLGVPGLVVAIVVRSTLSDPRGQYFRFQVRSGAHTVSPQRKQTFRVLWGSATFRNILVGLSIAAFFSSGIGQWQAAFFIRSYQVRTGELGLWLALASGIAGMVGTYMGGELATRYAPNNEALHLKVVAWIFTSLSVIQAFAYLSTNYYVALSLIGVSTLAGALANGPLFAAIHAAVPEDMRAMSIAVLYLLTNLIGLGLGPVAAGALSDAFSPWAQDESLRYALVALSPGYVWCGVHLFKASVSAAVELQPETDCRVGTRSAALPGPSSP